MCLLGIDIGSSSIKVSIVDKETGLTIGSDFYPKVEAPIKALQPGWAEQNPEDWWSYTKNALAGALKEANIKGEDIKARATRLPMWRPGKQPLETAKPPY